MTSANYSYFMGIFESFSSLYAVFVLQCQQVAQIAQTCSIYRVKSVEFIALNESIDDRDSKPIIANIKKVCDCDRIKVPLSRLYVLR